MGNLNVTKYKNDFNKENYDRLNIQVPKGKKEEIKAHQKTRGYKSINDYINSLIKNDMEGTPMNTLTNEEEFILNRFRYGSDEDRESLWSKALEIDSKYTAEERKALFEKRQYEITLKGNKGNVIIGDNGTINTK